MVETRRRSKADPSALTVSTPPARARYGRYRVRPDGDNQYFDGAAASGLAPNFVFDENRERIGPAKMRTGVQLASAQDPVNDATVHWTADRPEVEAERPRTHSGADPGL